MDRFRADSKRASPSICCWLSTLNTTVPWARKSALSGERPRPKPRARPTPTPMLVPSAAPISASSFGGGTTATSVEVVLEVLDELDVVVDVLDVVVDVLDVLEVLDVLDVLEVLEVLDVVVDVLDVVDVVVVVELVKELVLELDEVKLDDVPHLLQSQLYSSSQSSQSQKPSATKSLGMVQEDTGHTKIVFGSLLRST